MKIENCSIERNRCRDLTIFVFASMKKFSRFDDICFVTTGKFILFLFKLAGIGDGSRKIDPEENCAPTLILTLTLNQTLILTGAQFSSGAIVRTPLEIA